MKFPSGSLLLAFTLLGCRIQQTKPVSGPFSAAELKQFSTLNPIDAHTHIFLSDPAFYATLKKLNIHILTILVIDDTNPMRSNLFINDNKAWQVVHAGNGRVALCTTFDPYQFSQPGFVSTAIRQINQDFDQGAVAVKIWKNIGMELTDARGNYILPDDPRFEPIYQDIAAHNKTLIAHLADPTSLWEAPNPQAPAYPYYKANPQWYMYEKPRAPSKEQILGARDHLLEQNPGLRVVGAHLGSREDDLNRLARSLDCYPNFAVDLAGRVPDLAMHPRAEVIAFITRYQDRLIYGTDLEYGFGESEVNGQQLPWEYIYAGEWRFFATDDRLSYRGHVVRGLALTHSILLKLYHENAIRWFPGLAAQFD